MPSRAAHGPTETYRHFPLERSPGALGLGTWSRRGEPSEQRLRYIGRATDLVWVGIAVRKTRVGFAHRALVGSHIHVRSVRGTTSTGDRLWWTILAATLPKTIRARPERA